MSTPPLHRLHRRFIGFVGMLLATAAVLPGLGATPAAAQPAVQEFMVIEVDDTYDMGAVTSLHTPFEPDEPLQVRFAANFAHAGLTVSITPLEHESEDREINPSRIFLKHPGTGIYEQLNQPRNITGPVPPGVFQVDMIFRVNLDFSFPPGTYSGILTITVAPN